ncbi:hypothetical protein ACOME3_003716 [Neoechinorhynchus agilis]
MLRHRRSDTDTEIMTSRSNRWREMSTMAVLFLVNLLNYMDRFTIAGVLDQIQDYFSIDNASGGLLQTVFICSFMILAPLFGYLGDRYNRRVIMATGIFVWSLTTFLGSFVPSHLFSLFVVLRGLVGIGEASYSCVAPSVIADLYDGDARSKMLAVYYLAIPVGSGFGYVVGSRISLALGSWKWALRVTPPIGILCIVLFIFLIIQRASLTGAFYILRPVVVKEPRRGQSEIQNTQHRSSGQSSYLDDLMFLCGNRSYVGTSVSFTAVAFSIGAVSWWSPNYMKLAYELRAIQDPQASTGAPVSLIFGVITCLAGILGVVVGSTMSRRLKPVRQNADPLICGFAVLLSVPFMFLAVFTSRSVIWLSWILIFVGTTLISFTWSLIADIILYGRSIVFSIDLMNTIDQCMLLCRQEEQLPKHSKF